jgi:transcriptional regulator with XRE-family HTH domain
MDIKKVLEDLTKLGYSREEISELTGICRSTVSRVIRGKVKNPHLSADQWEKLNSLTR